MFSDFIQKCTCVYSSNPEEFIENCKNYFEQLLDGDLLTKNLNQQLAWLIADPSIDPLEWDPKHLVLASTNMFTLHLGSHTKNASRIYGVIADGLIGVTGKTPLKINRYSLPENYRNDIFDKNVRLMYNGEELIKPGQVLKIESTREVIDFVVTEPVTLLKFFLPISSSLMWSFSRETLLADKPHASTIHPTILTYLVDLVVSFNDQSSVPALVRLSEHSSHFVRWKALQGLGKINKNRCIDIAQLFIEDPHPHLRAVASDVFKSLSKQQEVSR